MLTAAGGVTFRRLLAAVPATAGLPPSAAPGLQPFPLADVRLLDGPFLEAQKRNEAYLLKLEPDRLLHNFRVNAGLEPKAPIYGGWESAKTWEGIRAHGHTLGHYLTAASLMYASSGHEEMKRRVDYIVGELKECQDAAKTGLVCAFPDNTAQIDNMVAGRRVTGVPWYTLHKIYAGLRDAHLFGGSAPAREVLVRLAGWAVEATKGMTDAQFERMLGVDEVAQPWQEGLDTMPMLGDEQGVTELIDWLTTVIADPTIDVTTDELGDRIRAVVPNFSHEGGESRLDDRA